MSLRQSSEGAAQIQHSDRRAMPLDRPIPWP